MPNYQVVPIEMNFGVDAGTDPHVSKGLLKVENGRWNREGAIEKRVGSTRADASYSNTERYITEYNGYPLTYSPMFRVGSSSSLVSTSNSTSRYVYGISKSELGSVPFGGSFIDYAECDSFFAVSASMAAAVHGPEITTYDKKSGALISTADLTGDVGSYCRMCRVDGSDIYAVTYTASPARLYVAQIYSGGGIGSSLQISGYTATSDPLRVGFDTCCTPGVTPNLSIIASNSSNSITLFQLPGGVFSAPTMRTLAETNYITAFCCCPFDVDKTFFAWATLNNATGAVAINACAYDSALSASPVMSLTTKSLGTNGSKVTNLSAVTVKASSQVCLIAETFNNYSTWPTANYSSPYLTTYEVLNTAGTGSFNTTYSSHPGLKLSSKLFMMNDEVNALVLSRQYKPLAPNLSTAPYLPGIQGEYWLMSFPSPFVQLGTVSHPIDASSYASYRCEEAAASTTLQDTSGNGNSATYVGSPGIAVDGTAAKIGSHCRGGGWSGTQYFQLPDWQPSAFTISTWWWYENTPQSGTVINRYNSGFSGYPNFYAATVGLYTGGANPDGVGGLSGGAHNKPCAVLCFNGSPSVYSLKYTGTALPTNTWAHLALTWDGSWAKLYVNGVLADSLYQPGRTLNYQTTSDSNHWHVGVAYDGSSHLTGNANSCIDDLNLYNEAKSHVWIDRAYAMRGGTWGLNNWSTARLQGRVLFGSADCGQYVSQSAFASNVMVSDNSARTSVPLAKSMTQILSGAQFPVRSVLEVSGYPTPGPSTIPYGRTTFIGGGAPTAYSGTGVIDHGIPQFPEFPVITSKTSGGNLSAGVISFRCTYETIDNAGNLHRSAPTSTPVSTTLTTETKVVLAVPCTPSMAQSIVVWRTESNGTNYYRAATVANDPLSESVTVNITEADTVLTSYEPLYTDSGELPNSPAPPYFVGCAWNNRLFAADKYDPTIWYTKPISSGFAPAFTWYTYQTIDPQAGPITAMFPLVDKLIICTKSRTYAMEGTGLDALGGGSNFVRPYLISQSTGCESNKTAGPVNDGWMIKGQDILWKLDPNLQMTPIGEQVRYYTDRYAISSIVPDEDNHSTIVFTNNGPALCYDWLRSRWSVFWNRKAADAASVKGSLYWIYQRGRYFDPMKETPVYKDNVLSGTGTSPTETDTYIPQLVDTGWIKLSDQMRYYKLLIYGYNISAHTLQVRIAYNYNPNFEATTYTLSSANTTAFNYTDYMGSGLDSTYADQAYVLQFSLPRSMAEAVRFEISDVYRTGVQDQPGWTLNKLALVATPKGSYKRRGSARRF